MKGDRRGGRRPRRRGKEQGELEGRRRGRGGECRDKEKARGISVGIWRGGTQRPAQAPSLGPLTGRSRGTKTMAKLIELPHFDRNFCKIFRCT